MKQICKGKCLHIESQNTLNIQRKNYTIDRNSMYKRMAGK